MSNKKVMFITGSLCDGGAEKVISILASGCARLGADVTLVILRDKERIYPVDESVNVIQIKSSGKLSMLQRVIQLHRIIKYSEATTLIPFVPIVTMYTLLSNIGINKKIIMSERADPNISFFSHKLSLKDKIGTFLMRTVGMNKLADWTVFQTPDAKKCYSKKVQEHSTIILNPLDIEKLPKRWEGLREKKIVAAGRFSEEKNFEMLFKAFAEFCKSHNDYKLVLYGEGKLRNIYDKLLDNLGIKQNVSMPGFSGNLHQEIQNSAMYISTSNHEGISNSMLEALGMGIPSIVTDCPIGGSRMFVETDVNGILIPMNDVEALTNAMCKIADNSDYAELLSKNSVLIRENLSREKICQKWLDLV